VLAELAVYLISMAKPLSKEFLLSRGECCGSGCSKCPYFPKSKRGSKVVFSPPEDVGCRPSCSLNTMQEGLCMCYLDFVENKTEKH